MVPPPLSTSWMAMWFILELFHLYDIYIAISSLIPKIFQTYLKMKLSLAIRVKINCNYAKSQF